MKAYLSDRAGRMEYGVSAAFQPSEQPRLSRYNASAANREARAILAETEPSIAGPFESIGGFPDSPRYYPARYPFLPMDAHIALIGGIAAILPVLDALEAEAR
jgi:hypothetical protein